MSFIYHDRNDDDYSIGWTPPKEQISFEETMKQIKRDLIASKQLLNLIKKDIERIEKNESKQAI